ncbi:MAG: hypothetical protein V1849_00835 [Chloroflexota bacterium]
MRSEKGFSTAELVIGIAIAALVVSAASTAIFQVLRGTDRTNDHLTVNRQVENAAFWITRDTQIAEGAFTDNLTSPNFLIFTWRERSYTEGDSIYHSATYLFQDLSAGVGNLVRRHWSSAGANEQTLIAKDIYWNPGDTVKTSQASYTNPVLSLRLTSQAGNAQEMREVQVKRRPNI